MISSGPDLNPLSASGSPKPTALRCALLSFSRCDTVGIPPQLYGLPSYAATDPVHTRTGDRSMECTGLQSRACCMSARAPPVIQRLEDGIALGDKPIPRDVQECIGRSRA